MAKADGALLSTTVDTLVEKLSDSDLVVKDFFKGKDAFVKLVRELKTKLSEAGPLLIDAEEKLIIEDQGVKKWLDDLKETIYEADDLVYKINTESLRKKQEDQPQRGCSSICDTVLMKLNPPLTAFDKAIKPEIEEIVEQLIRLLQENKEGLKLASDATGKGESGSISRYDYRFIY